MGNPGQARVRAHDSVAAKELLASGSCKQTLITPEH